jgi:hypothetical protein
MKKACLAGCLLAILTSSLCAQEAPLVPAAAMSRVFSNAAPAAPRIPEAVRKARIEAQIADDAYADALAKAAPELVDLDARILKTRCDLMTLLRQRLDVVRSAETNFPAIVAARNAAHENLTRAQVRQPVPSPEPPAAVPLPLRQEPPR